MPIGKEFSIEEKILIFRVIEFVESERNGLQIPLTSTSARVMALLGISYSSVYRLKKELEELRQQTAVEDGRKDEAMNIEGSTIRTRAQTSSVVAPTGHRKAKKTWSVKEIASGAATEVPKPTAPKKKENVGRRQVALRENAEDAIRYHFHLILVRINMDIFFVWKHIFRRLNGATPIFRAFWKVSLESTRTFQSDPRRLFGDR